jgi:CDP-glucose 4,6-dehydratase
MKNFWKNKKVLITGHTGFKGSWMTLILNMLGAKLYGYALDPITKPNFFDGLELNKFLVKDFRKDITNKKEFNKVIKKIRPSIIFHLAAQSSVLKSYKESEKTFLTNVVGTINLLEILRKVKSVKSAIIVTTDKVYLNQEKKKKFKESDHLGGYDIYSGSKASCEVLTNSYINSFFKNSNCKIATARSGNCIGGGDWTKDRIIKDCAEAFIFNKDIIIRSPKASRPWQHVIEPIFGYLKLAEKLFKSKNYVGSWNFGPNLKNNLKVIDVAYHGKKLLKSNSKIKIKKKKYYESEHLSLDISKSKKILKWKTILSSKLALKLTFEWYKLFYENKDKKKLIDFSFKQIKYYKKRLSRP